MGGGPPPSSQGGQWVDSRKVPSPQANGIDKHRSLCLSGNSWIR